MLDYFSENGRMRRNARNWLHLADKVFHFRRDILNETEVAALNQERFRLRKKLKGRANASELKLSIESLEHCLRQSGGTFYPKSTTVEYVEFFLVAAILFLGIRAFILQPFKIPTNSMWPSFYGMTGEVFQTVDDEPNVLMKALRFGALGASPRRVDAPVEGEIRLPIVGNSNGLQIYFRTVTGRRWLILPTVLKEYSIFVGEEIATVRVPWDFQLEPILSEAWFGNAEGLTEHLQAQLSRRNAREAFLKNRDGKGSVRVISVPIGREIKKGERLLSFDILTGDQLFVDRLSYHFIKPKVGDGFVFRTRNIAGLARDGVPDDKYYIKRLVGVPGDTLEVRSPVLLHNGEPISGSRAFELNARQESRYRGYEARGLLEPGQTLTVPEKSFFAMGDNSYNSLDGRIWGFVPEGDVVGRPLFIYYPFTRRWGPTR
ncbi:MAG: signal peptidase I [Opitutaceae bacterium]